MRVAKIARQLRLGIVVLTVMAFWPTKGAGQGTFEERLEYEISMTPASIKRVTTGMHDGMRVRLIQAEIGFDHVKNYLFLQWVGEPSDYDEPARVVATEYVDDINGMRSYVRSVVPFSYGGANFYVVRSFLNIGFPYTPEDDAWLLFVNGEPGSYSVREAETHFVDLVGQHFNRTRLGEVGDTVILASDAGVRVHYTSTIEGLEEERITLLEVDTVSALWGMPVQIYGSPALTDENTLRVNDYICCGAEYNFIEDYVYYPSEKRFRLTVRVMLAEGLVPPIDLLPVDVPITVSEYYQQLEIQPGKGWFRERPGRDDRMDLDDQNRDILEWTFAT